MCVRIFSLPAIALGLIALPATVRAAFLSMNFDDIATTPDHILDFYNGGLTSNGQGPGPAYGVTFSSNALVVTALTPIIMGNHRLQVPANETMFLNIPSGLGPVFSFYYWTTAPATLKAWDGPDGTGNVLRTVDFVNSSFDFAGIGNAPGTRSFTITATAMLNADNLTFADSGVLPEPSTPVLTLSTLLAIALGVWLRRS